MDSEKMIRGKRILVVEDEPIIAGLLGDMLMADGHDVEAVHTGRAALEKLATGTYDLIVSDLRMPVLDGRGLYRELEKHHRGDAPAHRLRARASALRPRQRGLPEVHAGALDRQSPSASPTSTS